MKSNEKSKLTEDMLNAAGDALVAFCAPQDRFAGIQAFQRALNAAFSVASLVDAEAHPETDAELPIFEIGCKDGHQFAVFLSGRIDGFPEGAVCINYALPIFAMLAAGSDPQKLWRARQDLNLRPLGSEPSDLSG